MIVRMAPRDHFVIIPNAAARDRQLSFKARGLLAYMLSMPDDWSATRDELAKASPDGVTAIRSALDELQTLGYIERRRLRSAGGKWTWVLEVRNAPVETTAEASASGAKPTTGADQPEQDGSAGRTSGGLSTGGQNAISSKEDLPPEDQEEDLSPSARSEEPSSRVKVEVVAPLSADQPTTKTDHRSDVERVCLLVLEHARAMGDSRVTITDKWRTEARLLLDHDRVPADLIERCLGWLATGPGEGAQFWRGNIFSVPKLRQQWPKLVAAAQRDRQRNGFRPGPGDRTADSFRQVIEMYANEDADRKELAQ